MKQHFGLKLPIFSYPPALDAPVKGVRIYVFGI